MLPSVFSPPRSHWHHKLLHQWQGRWWLPRLSSRSKHLASSCCAAPEVSTSRLIVWVRTSWCFCDSSKSYYNCCFCKPFQTSRHHLSLFSDILVTQDIWNKSGDIKNIKILTSSHFTQMVMKLYWKTYWILSELFEIRYNYQCKGICKFDFFSNTLSTYFPQTQLFTLISWY